MAEDHGPLVHEAPWGHEEVAQSRVRGRVDQSCEVPGVRGLGTGEVHEAQVAHSGAGHLVHRVHWGLDQRGMVGPTSRVCLAGTGLEND